MTNATFELKPATRTNVKPLICFYGESGSGKTYSALLLARGFVGPTGRIGFCDTESGRGSLYADVIPGGYEAVTISEPFSPARAVEAIQAIEKSGVAIGIIDSLSHFWEGIGGVCDQADQNEQKTGKPGLHCWRQPKMEHARMVLKFLQSPLPWIICLRAKYKSRQGKNAQGKTEIVKDDFPTPIQEEGLIYESTVHGLIDQEHRFILRKSSHPELRRCMPNNEMVTMEHGKLLAQWCASAGQPNNPDDPNVIRKELWAVLQPVRGAEAKWDLAEDWLKTVGVIAEAESLKTASAQRLREIMTAAKEKLQAVPV